MPRLAMRSDYDVDLQWGTVEVTFKPTQSVYTYTRLGELKHGPVSRLPRVRHAGATGDIDNYRSNQVEGMAYQLAVEACNRKPRRD